MLVLIFLVSGLGALAKQRPYMFKFVAMYMGEGVGCM